MSMSTQACNLLNMSQMSSARDTVTNIGGKRPLVNNDGPDLLPIDEDVDDEKCSPIKPKKRTSEDSPFKKRLAAIRQGLASQNGNQESS